LAKKRKFAVYKTLASALSRAGVNYSGATATVLLQAFVENRGILTAMQVEEAGLLVDTEDKNKKINFKAWRDPLLKGGWLVYDHNLCRSMGPGYGSYHQPGKKLVPYLNKELNKAKLVATKDEVDSMRADYSELRIRVEALETAVDSIIEIVDPPTSPEKRIFYTANPERLVRVM